MRAPAGSLPPGTLRIALVAGLLGALSLASPAAAQRCQAPPGTAAIEQYCETVPTGTGERAAGERTSPPAAAPLAPRTERALRASGEDGQALAELLTEPGDEQPGAERTAATRTRAAAPRQARREPPAPRSDPLHAIQASVDSGATLGGGFAWSLVALTLLAIAIAWRGYRRRSDG